MQRSRYWAALVVLAVSGCSREPELTPVTGTVKIDGQPAEGVQVGFWPADEAGKNSRNRYATGMTGRDGRFEVRSISEKGLEPGEYKVTFSRTVADGKLVTDPKKKPNRSRQTLLDKYTDQETTDITARVALDNHDFVFDLLSKPK
jgi:hypothetical protein